MSQKQIDKELQRQAVLFDEQCSNSVCVEKNITLSEFLDKWFADYAEANLSEKTVTGYRYIIRRVYAALGHKKLTKIKPTHIMEFYKNLRETGMRADMKYMARPFLEEYIKANKIKKAVLAQTAGISERTMSSVCHGNSVQPATADKLAGALDVPVNRIFRVVGADNPLSDKTIMEYHRLLHVIFKTAMRWQYMTYNPCDMVTPPKLKRKEAVYLDETQAAAVFPCLENEPIKPATMIKLFILTGLRRGELCGLQWKDIDFERKLLTVSRSAQYLPGRGIYDKDTKTEASKRTIKIPDAAIDILLTYREWQDEQRVLTGDQWKNTGRIFCDDFGGMIHPQFIIKWFSKFVKRHNLPPVHIHSLRHTNATLLIAGGVPLRTVSSRLGHTMLSTTGDIYAHAIQAADELAANTLQDIFHPIQEQKA